MPGGHGIRLSLGISLSGMGCQDHFVAKDPFNLFLCLIYGRLSISQHVCSLTSETSLDPRKTHSHRYTCMHTLMHVHTCMRTCECKHVHTHTTTRTKLKMYDHTAIFVLGSKRFKI